ncbi:MAG: hypothetical protein Fur0037_14890 [Planctomycetota bacterium]
MQTSALPHELAADVFKSVAEPTRVLILATILRAGELCVCHVESALRVTQSRASRHLAALKRAGLVIARREGAWTHYRAVKRPGAVERNVLKAVLEATRDDPRVRDAVARAGAIQWGSCGAEAAR